MLEEVYSALKNHFEGTQEEFNSQFQESEEFRILTWNALKKTYKDIREKDFDDFVPYVSGHTSQFYNRRNTFDVDDVDNFDKYLHEDEDYRREAFAKLEEQGLVRDYPQFLATYVDRGEDRAWNAYRRGLIDERKIGIQAITDPEEARMDMLDTMVLRPFDDENNWHNLSHIAGNVTPMALIAIGNTMTAGALTPLFYASVGVSALQSAGNQRIRVLEENLDRARIATENGEEPEFISEGAEYLSMALSGIITFAVEYVGGKMTLDIVKRLPAQIVTKNAKHIVGALAKGNMKAATKGITNLALAVGVTSITNASEEAIEEGIEQVLQNIQSRLLIDKDQKILQDIGEAMGQGFIGGLMVGFPASVVGTVKQMNSPDVLAASELMDSRGLSQTDAFSVLSYLKSKNDVVDVNKELQENPAKIDEYIEQYKILRDIIKSHSYQQILQDEHYRKILSKESLDFLETTYRSLKKDQRLRNKISLSDTTNRDKTALRGRLGLASFLSARLGLTFSEFFGYKTEQELNYQDVIARSLNLDSILDIYMSHPDAKRDAIVAEAKEAGIIGKTDDEIIRNSIKAFFKTSHFRNNHKTIFNSIQEDLFKTEVRRYKRQYPKKRFLTKKEFDKMYGNITKDFTTEELTIPLDETSQKSKINKADYAKKKQDVDNLYTRTKTKKGTILVGKVEPPTTPTTPTTPDTSTKTTPTKTKKPGKTGKPVDTIDPEAPTNTGIPKVTKEFHSSYDSKKKRLNYNGELDGVSVTIYVDKNNPGLFHVESDHLPNMKVQAFKPKEALEAYKAELFKSRGIRKDSEVTQRNSIKEEYDYYKSIYGETIDENTFTQLYKLADNYTQIIRRQKALSNTTKDGKVPFRKFVDTMLSKETLLINKELYALAEFLGIKVNVTDSQQQYLYEEKAFGEYDPSTKVLSVRLPRSEADSYRFINTLNHEIIHAMFDNVSRTDYIPFNKELHTIYDLILDAVESDTDNVFPPGFISHLNMLTQGFTKQATPTFLHGLFEELVTHSMTNPSFAKYLDMIHYTANTKKASSNTILGKLKDITRALFGRTVKKKTVLDEIQRLSDSVFEKTYNQIKAVPLDFSKIKRTPGDRAYKGQIDNQDFEFYSTEMTDENGNKYTQYLAEDGTKIGRSKKTALAWMQNMVKEKAKETVKIGERPELDLPKETVEKKLFNRLKDLLDTKNFNNQDIRTLMFRGAPNDPKLDKVGAELYLEVLTIEEILMRNEPRHRMNMDILNDISLHYNGERGINSRLTNILQYIGDIPQETYDNIKFLYEKNEKLSRAFVSKLADKVAMLLSVDHRFKMLPTQSITNMKALSSIQNTLVDKFYKSLMFTDSKGKKAFDGVSKETSQELDEILPFVSELKDFKNHPMYKEASTEAQKFMDKNIPKYVKEVNDIATGLENIGGLPHGRFSDAYKASIMREVKQIRKDMEAGMSKEQLQEAKERVDYLLDKAKAVENLNYVTMVVTKVYGDVVNNIIVSALRNQRKGIPLTDDMKKSLQQLENSPFLKLPFLKPIRDKLKSIKTHTSSKSGKDSIAGHDSAGIAVPRKLLGYNDALERGLIQRGQVSWAAIMGVYAFNVSETIAYGNLIQQLVKDGLLHSIEPNQRKPKGMTEVKRKQFIKDWGINPKRTGNYARLAIDTNVMRYLQEVRKANSSDKGLYNRILRHTKNKVFINPIRLPLNDVIQSIMLGSFSWKGIKKAAQDYYNFSDDFMDMVLNGGISSPATTPKSVVMEDYIKGSKNFLGKIMYGFTSATSKVKSTDVGDGKLIKTLKYPFTVINEIYNTSQEYAWRMDQIIRMMSYNHLRDQGYNAQQSGYYTALYHGDYANIPPEVRKSLNRVFFTPSFRISMVKLYTELVRSVGIGIKTPSKAGQHDIINTRAVMNLLAINLAFDMLMIGAFGYEREEWGRRYKKAVETETGPKTLVMTFTNPANLVQNYMGKAFKMVDPTRFDKFRTFLTTFQFDFHPLYRTAFEAYNNYDNVVRDTMKPLHIQMLQTAKYLTTRLIPLLAFTEGRPSDSKHSSSMQLIADETNQFAGIVLSLLLSAYETAPEAVRIDRKLTEAQTLLSQGRINRDGSIRQITQGEAKRLLKIINDIYDQYEKKETKAIKEPSVIKGLSSQR